MVPELFKFPERFKPLAPRLPKSMTSVFPALTFTLPLASGLTTVVVPPEVAPVGWLVAALVEASGGALCAKEGGITVVITNDMVHMMLTIRDRPFLESCFILRI